MFFKNPLDNEFKRWGRSKRVSSANFEMKQKVLSTLKTQNYSPTKLIKPKFYWMALSAGLVVLLLFVGNNLTKKKSFNATYQQSALKIEDRANVDEYDMNYEQAIGLDRGDLQLGIAMPTDLSAKFNAITNQSSPSANDTREFLKYDYHATIKTREVDELTNRIQTIVRGYGGRIDSASTEEKFGYIHFVLPKSSFESFKDELKGLVGHRFFKDGVRMENLLSQKVAIEQSTETANKSFDSLKKELADLTKKHNATISSLQSQLNSTNKTITNLKNEVTTDTLRLQIIANDISRYTYTQRSLQKQIASENSRYSSQKNYLENKIKNTESQIDRLAKQDQTLTDNVETVQGTISVQWISLFGIVKLYSPHYWLWIIVLGVLALIFNRYNKRRVVELP